MIIKLRNKLRKITHKIRLKMIWESKKTLIKLKKKLIKVLLSLIIQACNGNQI